MRKTFLMVLIAFLISVSYAYAQDALGCCSNPGAGQLACTSERLLFTRECCPQPESNFTGYYRSLQNPNGPANYAECTSGFFASNKACASVESCSIGCCCSVAGGTIKPEAQCRSSGQTFHKGTSSCSSICPTPQCSDGIDNDNNGCRDFENGDTGCQSPADATESGGRCLPAGYNCNNPSYTPKLSGFDIAPVKGRKSLLLQWADECAANSLYYEISRCEGTGCTSFSLIATTNSASFEDSSGLEFGKFYTYQLKAYYNLQSATPTLTKAATLGDLECLERTTANPFCMNNTAYYCNNLNKIVAEGTVCNNSSICAVRGNRAACYPRSACEDRRGNPFGLFYVKDSCEKDKWILTAPEGYRYCFFDRSNTIINYCFSCSPSMSCYDYKSEAACSSDNCGIENCEWKRIPNQEDKLELGVCASKTKYNCEWCNKKGTQNLENLKSYNEIFDTCTLEKSRALSTGSYKCYFNNGISKSCENVVCPDYSTDQCGTSRITHDEFNSITNPSNDECGIKLCQNINSVCAKNADGDSTADCSNAACEQDYFAPNTTLIAISRKGIVESIAIQIYDKRNSNNSYVLQAESNYSTFICLEPCGQSGHPYPNSTQARNLIVSNLNVYDGRTGVRLFRLNEGQSTIRYYSQDPSKNIGQVKRLALEAHDNSTGPKVLSFNVTSGLNVGDKLYTSTAQPRAFIRFIEPSTITYAKIKSRDTGAVITLDHGSELREYFDLPIGALPEGEYKIELMAKNARNIFMAFPFVSVFVIDSTPPSLRIAPANGETVIYSPVFLMLNFSEEVQLHKARLSSSEWKSFFKSIDGRLFVASINLTDGSKTLEVIASDFAGNRVERTSTFIVDSSPTDIRLIKPRFGVSPSYNFDIMVETDNNAECRYELDDNLEYNFMQRFTVTTGSLHTIRSFSTISSAEPTTRRLFVKCRDAIYGISSALFDLSVDTTSPQIKSAFAFPDPIVESPMETTLTVQADEPAVCKYSRTASQFNSMENKFWSFDEFDFNEISRQNITIQTEGKYSYYVACMNKAELVSGTAIINFTSNLSNTISIKSHTPRYFNSSNVVLAIETNKKSQCKYSQTDSSAQSGQVFSAPGYDHVKQLTLAVGNYTFHIICKDQHLQQWSNIFRINLTIDNTPPAMLLVNDTSTINILPEKTCNLDRLRVRFLGYDSESGVKQYSYTIFRDAQAIINPKNSFAGDEWIWVENLSLQDNTRYAFSVKARNHAELEGVSMSSDGISVDTNACKPAPRCGDSLINRPGEECDGNTLGIISSCLNYTNFIGGVLKCSSDCRLDVSGCTRIPDCGNNLLDPGESCDGSRFGIIDSCSKYSSSFNGGTLKCTSACQLDTSSCTEKPKCGNGKIDREESCDGTNLGPLSGKCTDYSASTFTDGDISCGTCRLDTSTCQGILGTCGDGILNIGESCDGNAFGRITKCSDYGTFDGGTLKCTSTCQLDTSSCTEKPKCGNSAIDAGESCDSTNFGPFDGKCSEYSADFRSGDIGCANCRLDTSGCQRSPLCGNNRLDGEELCDGSLFKLTNLSCTNYKSTFNNGSLSCTSSCRISTGSCDSNVSDAPPVSCRDRGTCELNQLCEDNSDCRSRYCASGKCREPSCSDSIKNQAESDIDCGGVCSSKCNDGRICNLDSDCNSNYCNFGTCSAPEPCNDGTLSPGESDVDCGGSCISKCAAGKVCINDDDCSAESKCISSQCTAIDSGTKDTDGDGMPDDWEFANGLDPNNPNDAGLDFDNDGLTNKEEYDVLNLYSGSTDPTEVDTDGDGFSDKEELDKNTDPTDPESFPKSSKLKVILFIAGIIILISGFGYLGYVIVQRKNESAYTSLPRQAPRQIYTPPVSRQPAKPIVPSSMQQKPAAGIPSLKERVQEKDAERKKLFEGFGAGQEQKPKYSKAEPKQETRQTESAKQKPSAKTARKQEKSQKSKEDVFAKLRTIAQERKKRKK